MINNVVLVGRLTKDCDLKYTSSGTAVGTFTLADDFTLLEPKQTTEQRPRESTQERQQEQKRSNFNDFNNTPDPFSSHGEPYFVDDDSLPF